MMQDVSHTGRREIRKCFFLVVALMLRAIQNCRRKQDLSAKAPFM